MRKVDLRRKGDCSERGAALVMVLMVSALMVVACVALLTAAAMNTKNVSDAVAEDQAYYAAESGLQATINVLRGNTSPSPLFNPTPDNSANKITFTKAVTPLSSNVSTDGATFARLSRWLNYSYTSPGASSPDRVILGEKVATYNSNDGMAYSIQVKDPDNTQGSLSYTTYGLFISYDTEGDTISGTVQCTLSDSTGCIRNSVTYGGTSGNTLKLEFIGNSNPSVTFDATTGVSSSQSLGNIRVTRTGTGATLIDALRFQIAYTMTSPRQAARYVRGTITQTPTSFRIQYDSDLFFLMGSDITIENTTLTSGNYYQNINQPSSIGSSASADTPVNATMTPAEPQRLLVTSTGYGPRGAKKVLEAIIQKNFFNDLSAPAALTMVGPSSGFLFEPGNSNNVLYSGEDQVSDAAIPSVGTTNDTNLLYVLKTPLKTELDPPAANVAVELPDWLKTTTALNDAINSLRTVAKASGRYYASGVAPPDFGSTNGTGITFCDGDVSLAGAGGGILVSTGKLTLRGNLSFTGLIIVTGAEGIDRSGGGNGTLAGNTVVAPYNPNNLAGGFLPPKYNISGGGTSQLEYNSNSVANGLVAISNFVLGVAEK